MYVYVYMYIYIHLIWYLALRPDVVFRPEAMPAGWTWERWQVIDISYLHVTGACHGIMETVRTGFLPYMCMHAP